MRILFLAYHFSNSYPVGVTSARIANALSQYAEVCVLSSNLVGTPFKNGLHYTCSVFPNSPSVFFIYLSKIFKKNLQYLFWEIRAYRKAKKIIREWHPDVIYSRALPAEVCAVGAKISEKFSIPILMHFTDPYPAPIEWFPDELRREIAISLMKKILPKASYLSFGNENMLRYQQHVLKFDLSNKSFISPDPSPSSKIISCPPKNGNIIRLIFLGAIYGNRNPVPLFGALKNLISAGMNIQLLIYDTNRKNLDAGDFVTFVGRTDDTSRAINSADILVDIDGDDSYPVYISSKFKDYLNFCRPILSISPSDSPTRTLASGLKTVICVDNKEKSIEESIRLLINTEFSIEDYAERDKLLHMFNPNHIAADIMKVFNKMIYSSY